MDDCTILVNSCDAYEDLWYPFFELLRIHWPECEFPIVLNTETKTYHHPNTPPEKEILTYALDKDRNLPWTTRLIETLKRIKTDYVLLCT